ncbi:MAG TPA: FtsW/RodA/SpoVE family cell cycle protein, partial [Patescibacteria group bacterium]|nr:FtsW/RodA/SpoVE family cell cycle protein [Patescibacteria group bacterium]
TGALIVLVMLQPDLGSAMILFFIWLVMVLLLPIRKKTVFIIFLIIVVLAAGAWFFLFKDYQKDRLLTFIQPQLDPLGAGYNVRQSVVAVGSGQLVGRGLALGSQSQLNFLPEQETDFIFAVIAEELGFVGASLLLILFFSLLVRLYRIAQQTRDDFGNMLALGVITYLTVQTFINMGMNMGIAPVTGVPLPLVSYGGSSLLSVLIALGIVLNIHLKNRSTMFSYEKEG